MRFIILFLCLFAILISNGYAACVNTVPENQGAKQENAHGEQKESFEFKFSDSELSELSKWKDKSFEDMWHDAFGCDRAALYMTGMCFLNGSSGLTIDVQKADLCFSRSASFGFAPALKQIINRNIEEENVFLLLVYSNLMTSLGHSEYVVAYHELRTKAMATFGNEISREIERIASCKKELIYKTIDKLAKSKDKNKFFVEMVYNGTLIDHQDKEFNQDYWIRFTKFQSEAENEACRFDCILTNDFQEFKKLYENSKKHLIKAIDKLESDETICELKYEAIKDIKKAIGKTEEFITLMRNFKNTSNDNLRKISKEFSLLAQNAKGVLEQHYNFFLAPHEFLESEDSMNKLTVYTAGVDEHRENIEELLNKLNNK